MKVTIPARKKARIEMLPLIDIVFLLLVVFIYAMLSMAVHRGLPVELPTSSSAQIEQKETLSVTVQQMSDGQTLIYVDENEVSIDELSRVLQVKAGNIQSQQGDKPGVLFFADSSISYQQLFKVLDTIRLAGLGKISLQAEEAKQ